MLCGGNFGMQLQPHVIELQRIFYTVNPVQVSGGGEQNVCGKFGGNCPTCPDLEPPLSKANSIVSLDSDANTDEFDEVCTKCPIFPIECRVQYTSGGVLKLIFQLLSSRLPHRLLHQQCHVPMTSRFVIICFEEAGYPFLTAY